MRTYAFLETQNVIETQRGIGYFVAENAYKQAVAFKKTEFLQEDLPKVFRTMDLLKIDLENLKNFYLKRKKDK
jgi:DNA-binding transcriptional regulator YhcF (GntR family)